MTASELKQYIDGNRNAVKARLRETAYFNGMHPAIYSETAKEAPDNRIPVPIPRKATNFVTGYMAKPGNITYSGDYFDEVLKDIYNNCEESILTFELLQTACVNGTAYELHWMDDKGQYFAEVPSNQCVMIYDDNLGIFSKPKYFIRYWLDANRIQHAESYDDTIKTEWVENGGVWSEVASNIHGYKEVPAVPFTINKDKTNLYNHVLALVDILDKGISEDIANELQRFASSYMLLANRIDGISTDENGETEVDKIRRTRIFDGLQDAVKTKVDFLTKQINPEFINTALDRIERLIYELIGVPNPSDDTFAASSGIALAYKLIPLEYLATGIQTYFSRGLQHRIRLMSGGAYTLTGNDDINEVTIKWNRNLPFDLATLSGIAMNLKGTLSDQTILGLFPSDIVPDVEEEMKLLEEQSETMDIESVDKVPLEEDNERLPEASN